MICGATKIWYYVPESRSSAFEAWLDATRPGYIENLEAGKMHAMIARCAPTPYILHAQPSMPLSYHFGLTSCLPGGHFVKLVTVLPLST